MKIGEKLDDVWFDGGIILKIEPYAGKYKEFFKYTVTVTATKTNAGQIEIAV